MSYIFSTYMVFYPLKTKSLHSENTEIVKPATKTMLQLSAISALIR